jgi:hypothetical protein
MNIRLANVNTDRLDQISAIVKKALFNTSIRFQTSADIQTCSTHLENSQYSMRHHDSRPNRSLVVYVDTYADFCQFEARLKWARFFNLAIIKGTMRVDPQSQLTSVASQLRFGKFVYFISGNLLLVTILALISDSSFIWTPILLIALAGFWYGTLRYTNELIDLIYSLRDLESNSVPN